jgi:hypothetical protein
VQGCIPVPVLAVHDGIVSCQDNPHHVSMARFRSSAYKYKLSMWH